jgi:hypothetical protein
MDINYEYETLQPSILAITQMNFNASGICFMKWFTFIPTGEHVVAVWRIKK